MKLQNKKKLQLNVQGNLPRSGYNIMNPQGGQPLSQSQMMPHQGQQNAGQQNQSLLYSTPLQLSQQQSLLQNQLCFKDKMTKVSEGIYVGSYMSALNKQALTQENITHIINCSPSDCQNMFEQDITYLNINIQDNWKTNLFLVIYIILDFLKDVLQQNGRVLIHCNQGISRSPSIIIAYYIYTEKINANIALEKLKKKYPYADPNLDFQIQLNEMYKEVVLEEEEQNLSLLSNYESQGYHSQQNLVSSSHSINSVNHLNNQSLISSQKIPRLNNQVINNSQHITISSPQYPSQKLNYGLYMQNISSRYNYYNPSHIPINLYGSAQIQPSTIYNNQHEQNLTLSADLYSNSHINKLQLDTIHENKDKQSNNAYQTSLIIPQSYQMNEKSDSSHKKSAYTSQLNQFKQNCLMPDLSYLKCQPILTLEQKQKMLFKTADSEVEDDDIDIEIPANNSQQNEVKLFLSQKFENTENLAVNNQTQEQKSQIKLENEQNQLNQQLLKKNSNLIFENKQILNTQTLQISKQISQDHNYDENTEILVKSPSPLKKNISKNNQKRNVGFEEKYNDLKNKMSDSDLDPLDSTDNQDMNTDTSASYSFDLQFSLKPKAKQYFQSNQPSTNQQPSKNTAISQTCTNNKKLTEGKKTDNQQINLPCSEISS